MLLSRRIRNIPSLDARMEDHNVYHSQFRVGVEIRRGVARDWAHWPETLRRGHDSARSSAILALTDGLGVRSQGRERLLRAGECLLDLRKNCWGVREKGYAISLVVEWEPGTFGRRIEDSFESLRISQRGMEVLRTSAQTIARSQSSLLEVRRAVLAIFTILRAHGVPLHAPSADAFVEKVSEQELVLGHLIDRALSHRGDRVGMVDLEDLSGWPERSLRRYLRQHLRKYHFNAIAWRELHRRWRLSTGLALMGARGATTEAVAQVLGYSSPTAFCRAFASAGLPSPGSIRRLL